MSMTTVLQNAGQCYQEFLNPIFLLYYNNAEAFKPIILLYLQKHKNFPFKFSLPCAIREKLG